MKSFLADYSKASNRLHVKSEKRCFFNIVDTGQCGRFMVFLPLRFYVKSILGFYLEVQKVPFFAILEPLNFDFVEF